MFDLQQFTWILPVTLIIIALIQVIYLVWLNFTGGGRERERRQPGSPIMPTNPQDGVMTIHPGQQPANYDSDINQPFQGKVIILSGLQNVGELELPKKTFGIGRFHNPDQNILIALDERSISRRHALFQVDEQSNEYMLTDTNSSYGTTIRKENRFELLTPGQPERIFNGDVVQFGNEITVRFILPGNTRAASTRI